MEIYLRMASVVMKVPRADSTSSISWAQVAPFSDEASWRALFFLDACSQFRL